MNQLSWYLASLTIYSLMWSYLGLFETVTIIVFLYSFLQYCRRELNFFLSYPDYLFIMEKFVLSSLPNGFQHIGLLPLQGGQSRVDLVKDQNGTQYVAKTVTAAKYRPTEQIVLHPSMIPHPYIVRGFVSEVAKTHAQFILEYCPHESIKEHPYLGTIENIIILRQLASALIACHKIGIVHGDVKLENILVYNLSPIHIKLCDFGLSFEKGKPPPGYQGTFELMAPELICGNVWDGYSDPCIPSDIWSYGATAFELFCCDTPFGLRNRGMNRLKNKILNVQIDWPDYDLPDYHNFRDFIQRLLKKNPDERMSLQDALNHPFLNPWKDDTSRIIRALNVGPCAPYNPGPL